MLSFLSSPHNFYNPKKKTKKKKKRREELNKSHIKRGSRTADKHSLSLSLLGAFAIFSSRSSSAAAAMCFFHISEKEAKRIFEYLSTPLFVGFADTTERIHRANKTENIRYR